MIIYFVAGGIVILGIVVFLFFFIRGKLQSAAIRHYEKMRDRITIEQIEHSGKEKKKSEEKIQEDYSDDDSPGFSGPGLLSSLIGGFVAIFVGVSLIGPITEQVKSVSTNSNLSDASTFAPQVLEMVPTFFIIGLVMVVLITVWSALRNVGVF